MILYKYKGVDKMEKVIFIKKYKRKNKIRTVLQFIHKYYLVLLIILYEILLITLVNLFL